MKKTHQPVLLNELIRYLKPKPNQNFIDATAGLGGHLKQILKKTTPNGKVLAIDYDPEAIEHLQQTTNDQRLTTYCGNFKNLFQIVKKTKFKDIDGIYFDLGLGSWQIEDPNYGLSFEKNTPLDMRIAPHAISAQKIVNRFPQEKLTQIFRKYGEVKRPHQIAEKIINSRAAKPIETTGQLVEITGVKNKKVLAKIFQALRIASNDEIENLKQALPQAISILNKGGKLAVISFHSLEDRIVKNFFRELQLEGRLKILTPKPIMSNIEEILKNQRARSAKLRVAEKV